MKGKWPVEYLHEPNVNKPIEQIWDDIDGYSFEELYQDTKSLHKSVTLVVPVPPLFYRGKFLKGALYTQVSDMLVEKFPHLKNIFNICANSMFASYPWSKCADAFFTCYRNEARETYYKNKYPEKKDIVCLPLQDADFLNEYFMAPVPGTPKTIDVICVSTPFPVKNLPMIARALKVYEQKYGRRLKVVYGIGQRCTKKREDGSLDYSELGDYGKNELIKVDEIFEGKTREYIQFEPYLEYKTLPEYYSASKCAVLGSLIEGKNRFISEALSADTPIICFKDFNKYARGDYPVFFGNSGEYVPEFEPESLADTIHKVISNPWNYEPRKNYLMHYGRRNFANIIVDNLPYYRENLPDYEKGRLMDNVWFDIACRDNYEVSYYEFLYDKKCSIMNVAGIENILKLIKYYYQKFGYRWEYGDENPFA